MPQSKLLTEDLFIVLVNENQIEYHSPKQGLQVVPWDELNKVVIITNDRGPWFCDTYWHIIGEKSNCIIPMGTAGEDNLIAALQKLQDFDNVQMIAAMTSVKNQQFICWKRE